MKAETKEDNNERIFIYLYVYICMYVFTIINLAKSKNAHPFHMPIQQSQVYNGSLACLFCSLCICHHFGKFQRLHILFERIHSVHQSTSVGRYTCR